MTNKLIVVVLVCVAASVARAECPAPASAQDVQQEVQKLIEEYVEGALTREQFDASVAAIDPEHCWGISVPECGDDCVSSEDE
jgi:hypothetical protein